jgi:hypothetical protein
MIWITRLAGLALAGVGADAIGSLVYQRMGAALDLRGCFNPSAQSIVLLDSAGIVALIGGFLLFARLRL